MPSAIASRSAPEPQDNPTEHLLEALAAYAHLASRRRGLTAGELAEDAADKVAAFAPSQGLALPFLQAVAAVFASSPHPIRITCDPALELPAAELAAIGTVMSESIFNALEHAFPGGRSGHIWVRLERRDGRVTLTVRDDGIGMPDLAGERNSGHWLIEALAQQLGGYARLGSAPFGGAQVSVVYPSSR